MCVVSKSHTGPGAPLLPQQVQVEGQLRWIRWVPSGPEMTASCHWSFQCLYQWSRLIPCHRITSKPPSQLVGLHGLWAPMTWAAPITRLLWLSLDDVHWGTLCLRARARWVHKLANLMKTLKGSWDVTLLFIYLARCYNGKSVFHSVLIMAEILLTRTKQYAWLAMLRWNAIVILQICGSIWYHSYGAMISAVNEWWIVQTRTVLFPAHILKHGRRSQCFQPLPSHYMTLWTQI